MNDFGRLNLFLERGVPLVIDHDFYYESILLVKRGELRSELSGSLVPFLLEQ